MTVPHVLVDGGSNLNICPEMTAKALGLKEEEYVPDPITIYGFDNHGQTAKGKIFLEIFINYSVHTVLIPCRQCAANLQSSARTNMDPQCQCRSINPPPVHKMVQGRNDYHHPGRRS